jgi:hypothetical protein
VLCPETSSSSSSSSVKSKYDLDKFFLIKAYEQTTYQGREITTTVFIKNQDEEIKEYSIYTYVNSGLYLASKGDWLSNKQTQVLKPGEYHYLTFNNTIRENATPGGYTLKARIVFDEYKLTDTKNIEILEYNDTESIQTQYGIEPEITSPKKEAKTTTYQNETKQTLLYQAKEYDNIHWILMAITFGILSVILIWFKE